MNYLLAAAGFACAITCLVHVIVGGKFVARPLLAATQLNRITKFTAYYCWHIVTITIAGMAIAFFIAASDPDAMLLAVFATSASFLFLAWSLGMIFLFRLPLMHFPQWILFFPGFILGLWGILA